jgi:hypothetical protein
MTTTMTTTTTTTRRVPDVFGRARNVYMHVHHIIVCMRVLDDDGRGPETSTRVRPALRRGQAARYSIMGHKPASPIHMRRMASRPPRLESGALTAPPVRQRLGPGPTTQTSGLLA